MIPITLPYSTRPIHHKVLFVRGLQVPCILGMDFMRKARIIIDTHAGKMKVEPPLHGSFQNNPTHLLRLKRETTIKPREEIQVIGECDLNFEIALVNSNNHPKIYLMDGIINGRNSKECPLVLLNPSLETINVPRGTVVGN